MIPAVVLAVAVAAVCLVLALTHSRRQAERARYCSAAWTLLQNEILDHEIRNHDGNIQNPAQEGTRTMLYLRVRGKPPQKYVLDPRDGILFGRDSHSCDVLLHEAVISEQQCRIWEQKDCIWLTDLGSANGTVLRRGLFHRYTLRGGQSIRLQSGDRLQLGQASFDLILFPFNRATM